MSEEVQTYACPRCERGFTILHERGRVLLSAEAERRCPHCRSEQRCLYCPKPVRADDAVIMVNLKFPAHRACAMAKLWEDER